MAIDTAAKRASVLAIQTRILPPPDNTIAQADRQSLVERYGGILSGAAPVQSDSIQPLVSNIVFHITQPSTPTIAR